MKSKNEDDNNPINLIKIKSKKKETFDSETTGQNSNSDNIKVKKKHYKKSVDFFPKKMEIDEIEEDFTKRRNTISMCGNIKNFVPQIKPIKIDLIPSKLRLNKIGFKDLKCNKNNKVLFYANKLFISCPNIQDEEIDDEIENLRFYDKINVNSSGEINNDKNKIVDINKTRKHLQITKNKKIPKVGSVNNPHLKNKYNNELNIGISSDSELYDIDESINDSINENVEDNYKINIEENEKKRDRYNSWSILDVLQKKNKLDEK